jgi:hypothetical protein
LQYIQNSDKQHAVIYFGKGLSQIVMKVEGGERILGEDELGY